MGHGIEVVCSTCQQVFWANDGGGFEFHLLHCAACGAERTVLFAELGELHLRYLKGLSVPYSMFSREHDLAVQAHSDLEPLDEATYEAEVEKRQPSCSCGGVFTFAAEPRCPGCGATGWEETGLIQHYD